MYNSQHIITARHYLALCIIAFASGIYLAAQLGFLKALICVFFITLAGLAVFIIYSILKNLLFSPKIVILPLLLVAFLCFGILRLFLAESPAFNTLTSYKNTEAWVFGTVSSQPRYIESSHSCSFELDVFRINDDASAKGTIVMYIPQSQSPKVRFGDSLRCWTKLSGSTSHPDSLSEDYYTRLKGRNIFLSGNTKNVNILGKSYVKTPVLYLKSIGNLIRTKISGGADLLFSQSPQKLAILKGILVGDKSDFDDELYEKLSNSGISHIVAVSGLHLSILFSFLIFIMSGLNVRKRLRLLAVVPFVLLFMAASAFTPSVCRASAMLLIMIFSSFFSREYDPITSLFFALGCILISSPFALFSKSLVLSFSATLGIFVYFGYFNRSFLYPFRNFNHYRCKSLTRKLLHKGYTSLSSSLALSLASLLGTAYFLAIFFGKISKVQFLTNLWIVPVVSVVFCLGYISCIVCCFCPWLAQTLLKPPLNLFLEIISLTADRFGGSECSFEINADEFSGIHIILYFGCAYILYMTFKLIHDIRIEKKLKILK